jgi:hypothetical protein
MFIAPHSSSRSHQADVLALLNTAPHTALTPKQQREVTAYLASHPEVVSLSSVTPGTVGLSVVWLLAACVRFYTDCAYSCCT